MESVGNTISCRFAAPTVLLLAIVFTAAGTAATSQDLPSGIRWTVQIPAAPSTPPVIAGERVFVTTLPGLLTAHDMKDGHELWREPIAPDQPVVAEGERLFIAAGEAVHALQIADRAVLWRSPTGTLTAPLIVKEGWVIAASATRMLALRATDGSKVWEREATPQRARGTIDGNVLFVPLASGVLRAIDLTNGSTLWERPFAGVPAEPLVIGERIYLGATDKNFYSLKIADGDIDWTISVGAEVRVRAATDGERVFFVGLDNLVRAVNRGNGHQRWLQGVPFRPFTGPAVSGGSVFIAGPATDVRILNAATGSETGKITFPEPLVMPPSFGTAIGEVVVAGVSGSLTESWKLWLASPVKPAAKPAD